MGRVRLAAGGCLDWKGRLGPVNFTVEWCISGVLNLCRIGGPIGPMSRGLAHSCYPTPTGWEHEEEVEATRGSIGIGADLA